MAENGKLTPEQQKSDREFLQKAAGIANVLRTGLNMLTEGNRPLRTAAIVVLYAEACADIAVRNGPEKTSAEQAAHAREVWADLMPTFLLDANFLEFSKLSPEEQLERVEARKREGEF